MEILKIRVGGIMDVKIGTLHWYHVILCRLFGDKVCENKTIVCEDVEITEKFDIYRLWDTFYILLAKERNNV